MFAEGDEGAFKRQGGLALSPSKLRSAGSPTMTIADISQVGQAERRLSHSQISSFRYLVFKWLLIARTPSTSFTAVNWPTPP